MKKSFVLILVFIIVFSCFCACGTQHAEKIVIWAYDSYVTTAEEAVKLYKETNPDLEFEIVELSQDDLVQKFRIALASGSAENLPDIIIEEDYNAVGYLKYYNDCFADLTDHIDKNKFVSYKVQNVMYKNKIYGMPYDSDAAALFYRIDYLEAAGFAPKDLEDITWERFIEIGQEVKRVTGKQMITICPEGNIEGRVILQSAGKWYYDLDGNLDIKDNVGLVRMMETMKMIYDSGIAYCAAGWDDIISSFYNGDVASIIGGYWWAPIIAENDSQSGLWRVAPLPKMSGDGSFTHYSMCGGCSWFVLNKPNSEVAIDFLTSTVGSSIELANTMIEKRQIVPTLLSAIHCENARKGDPYFGGQNICELIGEWGELTPPVNYGEFPYEITYKHGELMGNYLNDRQTVDEILSELQQYAESLYQ